ncbi:tRNA guanosine(34) transglycosylase Tgt [bacterium]|nr:tRNA guanosine(34) transglycosylase Tgt [bacterium]
MSNLKYKLIQKDGKARAGLLEINNREVLTPTFMPVATKGALKSTPHEMLDKTSVLLANTYHLFLRPGANTIKELGGLHKFMNWNKLILTDSGGFQGWSLPTKKTPEGIEFKNIYDGSTFLMTPEISIKTQNLLGSDIAMIFDYVVDIDAPEDIQTDAIKTTELWARIAKQTHNNKKQAMFGIIQGGLIKNLREKSALSMINLDFDGYALGGLALGESRKERKEIVNFTTEYLPTNKPRYVMGLGDTLGLIDLIEEGIDMFDCVWPARLARHGKLITGNSYINIKNQKFANDSDPIYESCPCFTCKNYSRGFLRHLLRNEQTTAWLYLTIHNLIQTEIMLDEARQSILESDFEKFKKRYINE